MPTIVVLGHVKLQMFGNDHNPPHFHIVTPDGEAIVDLNSMNIIRGRLRSKDLRTALNWARQHAEELHDAWNELNG